MVDKNDTVDAVCVIGNGGRVVNYAPLALFKDIAAGNTVGDLSSIAGTGKTGPAMADDEVR